MAYVSGLYHICHGLEGAFSCCFHRFTSLLVWGEGEYSKFGRRFGTSVFELLIGPEFGKRTN